MCSSACRSNATRRMRSTSGEGGTGGLLVVALKDALRAKSDADLYRRAAAGLDGSFFGDVRISPRQGRWRTRKGEERESPVQLHRRWLQAGRDDFDYLTGARRAGGRGGTRGD